MQRPPTQLEATPAPSVGEAGAGAGAEATGSGGGGGDGGGTGGEVTGWGGVPIKLVLGNFVLYETEDRDGKYDIGKITNVASCFLGVHEFEGSGHGVDTEFWPLWVRRAPGTQTFESRGSVGRPGDGFRPVLVDVDQHGCLNQLVCEVALDEGGKLTSASVSKLQQLDSDMSCTFALLSILGAAPAPPPQHGPAPHTNPADFVVPNALSSSSEEGDLPVSSSSSFDPSSSSSSSSSNSAIDNPNASSASAGDTTPEPDVVTLAEFEAEFVGGGEVKAGIMAPVATAAKSLSLKASQPTGDEIHAAKHAQTLQCDSVEAVFKFEDVGKVVLAGSVDVSISGLGGDFNKHSKLRLDFRGLDPQFDGFVPTGRPQFVDRHSSHLLATFTSPCGLILKCYILSRTCFTTTHRMFRPAIPLGQRYFDVFRRAFQAAVVSLQDEILSGNNAHNLTTAFAQRLDAHPTHSYEPVPGARVHMGVGDFNAVLGEAVRVLVASVEGEAWLAQHCVYFDGIGWKDQLCADITDFPPRDDLLGGGPAGTPGWARDEVGRRLLEFLNLDVLSRGQRHDNGEEAPGHPDPISIRIDMRVQHSMHTNEGHAAIGMLLDTKKLVGLLGALRYKPSKMRVYTVMLPHAESSNIQLNTQGTEDPHDMYPPNPPMVSCYSNFKNSFMTFGRKAMPTAEPIMPWVHYLVGTESTAPSSNLPDISKFKVALQQSIVAATRVRGFVLSMAAGSTRASLQHNIEVGGANFTDTANFLIENFTYGDIDGDIDSLLSTSAKGVYLLVNTAEYWRVAAAVVHAWAVHLIAVLKRVATGVKRASDYTNITADQAQGEGHLCADSLATATVAEAFIHNLFFDGYSGTMFREALQHGFSHGGLMEFPGSRVLRPDGCSTAYLSGLQGLVAKSLETAKFQHFTSRSHSAKLTATIQKTRMWCGQLMRTLAQADGPGAQAPASEQMVPMLASVVFCAYVAWVRAQLKTKGVKQVTEKDPTNFTASELRIFAEEAFQVSQSGTKIGVCDKKKPALKALRELFVDQPQIKSRDHAFYLAIFQMAAKAIKGRGWAPVGTTPEAMLLKALAHHILDGGHCVHGSSTRETTMWQDNTRGNVILFYQLKQLEPFTSPFDTDPAPKLARRPKPKVAKQAKQGKPVVFTKADIDSYKKMANDLKTVRVEVLGGAARCVRISTEEYARVWHAMVVEHLKPGGAGAPQQVLGWKELTYSDPKYGFTLVDGSQILAAHRPFDSVADIGKTLQKMLKSAGTDEAGTGFDDIDCLARATPCSVLLRSPEAQAANHAVFSPKPPPPAPIGEWVPQPNTNPSTHMGPAAQPQHQQQHSSPVINVRLVGQRLPTSPSQGAVYLQQRANMSSVASFVLPTSVKPPTAATTTTAAAAAAAAAATTAAATTSKPGHGAPTGLGQGAPKRGRWSAHVPAHSVEGGKLDCIVGATLHCDGNGSVAAPEWGGQTNLTCPLCNKRFNVKRAIQ